MACSWIERLLLNWHISWLRFNVSWWLVLWVDRLILWLTGGHSDWRFAVSLHWHSDQGTWWCGLHAWSLRNGLSWNELFGLWNWSKLLLCVVCNVLFILSLLLSQLTVDLLTELFHELSHFSINFLVNKISDTFAHVRWNLIEIILSLLWHIVLLDWNSHFLLNSSLDNMLLPRALWLVA